jgi:hypothetical protein
MSHQLIVLLASSIGSFKNSRLFAVVSNVCMYVCMYVCTRGGP